MPKPKTVFYCIECGYESPKWLGRCPSCKNYNTINEEPEVKVKTANVPGRSLKTFEPTLLDDINSDDVSKIKTNISELDRVLSGGLTEGSLTLLGGEPGIGKSTLLLQICAHNGFSSPDILYISGEESLSQIKQRANRLGVKNDRLFILPETNIAMIEAAVKKTAPSLIIVDSIQTMYSGDLTSAPGSVTQIRECAAFFMRVAKEEGISVILVGHVTKEGTIAGPRVLEHMVDTVLYFEGEKSVNYRLIRAVKNRFGATNEIGVFEMKENGLSSITNPSEYMLQGRPIGASGSVVTCAMEGTRPILSEVQALVCRTAFGMPRRVANGLDYNRVVMLIAMLEKRAGIALSNFDSYVNIAGGMKMTEPSIDLAVVTALISCDKEKPINPLFMAFGEVGLAGEVRAVASAEKRVIEAEKLGFKECAVPQANLKSIKAGNGIRVFGVSNIGELLSLLNITAKK